MSKLKRAYIVLLCLFFTIPVCIVGNSNNVYAKTVTYNSTVNPIDFSNVDSVYIGSLTQTTGVRGKDQEYDYAQQYTSPWLTASYTISIGGKTVDTKTENYTGSLYGYGWNGSQWCYGTQGSYNFNSHIDIASIKSKYSSSELQHSAIIISGSSDAVSLSADISVEIAEKPVFSGDLASGNLTLPCAYIVFV